MLATQPRSAETESSRSGSGWPLAWALLGVFTAGLALNLTPCVFPLIPITVSYFGSGGDRSKKALIGHAACYIVGLALTNSVLGVIAALTGGLIGALLQNALVLIAIAGMLTAFAFSLFGFWELRLPYGLTQAAARSYTGFFGSFFMGLALGVVAAPCVGPFVLGLLAWVAAMADPLMGFIVFFTLSVGLGIPLLILAVFSGQLANLPKSGEWMIWVRRSMGWVLIAIAVYFIRPLFPFSLQPLLLAAVAAAAGAHLGWIDQTKAAFRSFPLIKTAIGTICLVTAAVLVGNVVFKGPSVDWQPYSQQVMADALTHKKPVIIDFYADWCSPCRKMEQTTFHNPDVVKQSKGGFVMVKVDLTQEVNQEHTLLLEKFGVRGVPTIVFLDPSGQERIDLRLVGFVPPEEFLVRPS